MPRRRRRPRPSIGLALGGGIARGFVHIGVLQVLAKHGIEPDVVVGTSIGAVVGACHAAGKLDVFDQWARGLTTRGVLGYLDVSLGGSGLIAGNRLAERLEETFGDTLIEDLPKRCACIATELGTGHEIWLTRGRVVDAARASYALPGLFTPVRLGGRWLVDGALVNPVPVSAARALGARLVIAVNLNSDMLGRGGTIADHGPDADDARDAERDAGAPGRIAAHPEPGIPAQAATDRRQAQPEHRQHHDRFIQHHAGSRDAIAPRRRAARRHDRAALRQDRIVRLPSRQGSHRDRRAGGGTSDPRYRGCDRRPHLSGDPLHQTGDHAVWM